MRGSWTRSRIRLCRSRSLLQNFHEVGAPIAISVETLDNAIELPAGDEVPEDPIGMGRQREHARLRPCVMESGKHDDLRFRIPRIRDPRQQTDAFVRVLASGERRSHPPGLPPVEGHLQMGVQIKRNDVRHRPTDEKQVPFLKTACLRLRIEADSDLGTGCEGTPEEQGEMDGERRVAGDREIWPVLVWGPDDQHTALANKPFKESTGPFWHDPPGRGPRS